MRFARLGPVGAEIPTVIVGGTHLDLRPITTDLDRAFFADDGLARVREAVSGGTLAPLETTGLRVGAPIARPGKILCIGLNYRDHAAETRAQLPEEPVLFMKDPSTVVGPFDTVYVPRRSVKTDWEVELGVVIGSTARYLDSPEAALEHVAGYVVSHDVSEREFQLERGGQWDKGKSCETFNPLGPELVTADEVADPQDLRLSLSVNGVKRQDGTTADMVFGVAHIIWYLSQFLVLEPGDLINTGTPAGVALGIEGQPYLRAGDVVELSITGLGTACQTMEQA
ncbi:fumarylacetoacetate hydrolase family protein [Isoptericola croceus]|uniref:fumarylacetoacetate hydrolase family protein n=1 Tax=Isoptericola croceus TaxID=3031406 RepID=UPI0023F9A229|nr:fumarylacetoacetate hydrolase family protein [Isoptericola croceus]